MEVLRISDLRYELALHLDYDTLINYFRASYLLAEISKSAFFWQEKARLDFGTLPRDFHETFLSPAERYLQIMTHHGRLAKGSEKFLGQNPFLQMAVAHGREDLVDYLLERGYTNLKNLCLQYALQNRFDQVQAISGWTCPRIAIAVVIKGNLEIVKYLLSEISLSQIPKRELDNMIMDAIQSKNLSLVQYLIEVFIDRRLQMKWLSFITISLHTGDIPIFKYIMSKYPLKEKIFWSRIYHLAFSSGNQEFIGFILSRIPRIIRSPRRELQSAIQSGNSDLVQSIMTRRNLTLMDIDYSRIRLTFKNKSLVQSFIEQRPPTAQEYWKMIYREETGFIHRNLLIEILPLIPDEIYNPTVPGTRPTWIWSDDYFALILNYLKAYDPSYLLPVLSLLVHLDRHPSVNWNDVLIKLLIRQDQQELNMIFQVAGDGYLFDWNRILLSSEKIGCPRNEVPSSISGRPGITQYLLEMRRKRSMIYC